MPFSEDCCGSSLSIYGATKKSNELMAHSYSHLKLPVTGLSFLPFMSMGRPDMALFLLPAIINNEEIKVFNYEIWKEILLILMI